MPASCKGKQPHDKTLHNQSGGLTHTSHARPNMGKRERECDSGGTFQHSPARPNNQCGVERHTHPSCSSKFTGCCERWGRVPQGLCCNNTQCGANQHEMQRPKVGNGCNLGCQLDTAGGVGGVTKLKPNEAMSQELRLTPNGHPHWNFDKSKTPDYSQLKSQ